MRITVGNTSVMQSGMDRQESVQQRDGVTGRKERGEVYFLASAPYTCPSASEEAEAERDSDKATERVTEKQRERN